MISHLELGRIANISVYPKGIIGSSVDIIADGRDKTADIARTASTAIPFLAMMVTMRSKWIDIKESITIQTNSREYSVVKRTFHNVGILSIT